MERLIHFDSISSQTILNRIPLLRPAHLLTGAVKLDGFHYPPHPLSRSHNSISCVYQNPPSSSLKLSPESGDKNKNSKLDFTPSVNAPNGFSKDNIIMVGKVIEFPVKGQKVVTSVAVAILSALFMILIHPFMAQPAFASFKTTATGGSSVAAPGGSSIVRIELLNSAWTGFFAGCLHTLSGPDHLAALAPLSIGRTRLQSATVGALWGCGHNTGQIIFGLIFLILKDRLHIEILKTWGTRIVGFTLLVIGIMGIKESSEVHTPCVVALENGECDVSVYEGGGVTENGKKKIGFATFVTGIVHGLQPDALMMILPALALPSRVAGAAFLSMFLVGTVVAMGSYTVLIGSCSEALKDRVPRITEKLTWASSLVAIALGVFILVSEFFGFSLY